MRRAPKGLALLALAVPLAAAAQHPHESERQRALIELDRRSAGFAGEAPLPPHVGRPLHPDAEIARQLRPYERLREREDGPFVLRLPPPVRQERPGSEPGLEPLPLPGGRQRGVNPVTLPRARG